MSSFSLILSSFLFASPVLRRLLRILIVVSHARLHLEEQHHGVIFMNGVVAVHRPVSLEVAEAGEDLNVFIGLQPGSVLARHLNVGNIRARGADAAAAAAIKAQSP